MTVNGYEIIGELNNANSGFSKWGFARKNGKEYFIKELITPVYPVDESAMSPQMYTNRVEYCRKFEERYKDLYIAVNSASKGNLVRITEFFRHGSRYYIVTEKVENQSLSKESIAKFSEEKKYLLLKSIAHCFRCLHNASVVHMDVKPNNFMIKKTASGNCIARLIDFDAGFIVGEKREENEELGGDLTYLAPEVFLKMAGEDVEITAKADVFSLGLVFCEYFTGEMPVYDKGEYDYIYEVALDTGGVKVDREKMPRELADLTEEMLSADPEKRPDANEIHKRLIEMSGGVAEEFFRAEKTDYSGRFITNIKTTASPRMETESGKKPVFKEEKPEGGANSRFSRAKDL